MNFFKKKFIKIINKKFSFLKLNLQKDFLIKIIYIETIMILKKKYNINEIKKNLIIIFFSFYKHINNVIKSIFNYKNDLFFIKQILFFVIIMKYLFFLILKKIIISFYSFNYSILFIKCKKNENFKNKDVVDVSTKKSFVFFKNIFNYLESIFNDFMFLISYILYGL